MPLKNNGPGLKEIGVQVTTLFTTTFQNIFQKYSKKIYSVTFFSKIFYKSFFQKQFFQKIFQSIFQNIFQKFFFQKFFKNFFSNFSKNFSQKTASCNWCCLIWHPTAPAHSGDLCQFVYPALFSWHYYHYTMPLVRWLPTEVIQSGTVILRFFSTDRQLPPVFMCVI